MARNNRAFAVICSSILSVCYDILILMCTSGINLGDFLEFFIVCVRAFVHALFHFNPCH